MFSTLEDSRMRCEEEEYAMRLREMEMQQIASRASAGFTLDDLRREESQRDAAQGMYDYAHDLEDTEDYYDEHAGY